MERGRRKGWRDEEWRGDEERTEEGKEVCVDEVLRGVPLFRK